MRDDVIEAAEIRRKLSQVELQQADVVVSPSSRAMRWARATGTAARSRSPRSWRSAAWRQWAPGSTRRRRRARGRGRLRWAPRRAQATRLRWRGGRDAALHPESSYTGRRCSSGRERRFRAPARLRCRTKERRTKGLWEGSAASIARHALGPHCSARLLGRQVERLRELAHRVAFGAMRAAASCPGPPAPSLP